MIWLLYVGLVALVVTCTALVPWMKREGEREWARHQRRLRMAALNEMLDGFLTSMLQASRLATKAFDQMSVAMGVKKR